MTSIDGQTDRMAQYGMGPVRHGLIWRVKLTMSCLIEPVSGRPDQPVEHDQPTSLSCSSLVTRRRCCYLPADLACPRCRIWRSRAPPWLTRRPHAPACSPTGCLQPRAHSSCSPTAQLTPRPSPVPACAAPEEAASAVKEKREMGGWRPAGRRERGRDRN